MDTPTIFKIPPEILVEILALLPTESVSGFAQTCSQARELIYGPDSSTYLWRSLYLNLFDDPRTSGWAIDPGMDSSDSSSNGNKAYDWKQNLQGAVEALNRWENGFIDDPKKEITFRSVFLSLVRLLHTAAPAPHKSKNIQALSKRLLPTSPPLPPLSPEAQTLLTILQLHLDPRTEIAPNVLVRQARKITYSVLSYSPYPNRGPFNADGTVNWDILNSISTLMRYNISDFQDVLEADLGQPLPWDIEHARPKGLADGTSTKNDGDWANAGGKWKGMYAFLDYPVFMQLNYPRTVRRNLPPLLSDEQEHTGDLMNLTLTLNPPASSQPKSKLPSSVSSPGTSPSSSSPFSTKFHPLHYTGSSFMSSPDHATEVRAEFFLSPDSPPQLRARFTISYDREDRWSLEGVQVGGLGGRRGIFGVWSIPNSTDGESPSGPFYFWKVD
ncbi:F-box domain [Phaffia rhodozyma]|uniref:F-box domain n=1 Tax=Phaffia rhodozyma TaxID=264483 RepID=A0A0F7SP17_PHARH|nr:F-box domain [Phaffia rhodozyma]